MRWTSRSNLLNLVKLLLNCITFPQTYWTQSNDYFTSVKHIAAFLFWARCIPVIRDRRLTQPNKDYALGHVFVGLFLFVTKILSVHCFCIGPHFITLMGIITCYEPILLRVLAGRANILDYVSGCLDFKCRPLFKSLQNFVSETKTSPQPQTSTMSDLRAV